MTRPPKPASHAAPGYGPLIADPKGLLALPEGLSYTIVAQSGVTMLESGEPTPGDPDADTIELKLYFRYTPDDQDSDPDGPDNITVSAHGGLIIAEDGEGASHLVGSTDAGEVFFVARNELDDSEFAGPTFSNDKKTLFADIQSPGYVLAIQGPWRKQR